jgi:hypothetical protein
MAKGISEIVGLADGMGKSRVTVYRALKILMCAACGETIGEGVLFTRRSLYGQGLRILPKCRKCAPFDLRTFDQNEQRQSALIESLLTPPPEPSGVKQVRKPGAEREAVERRLGPALRRCRQRVRS